MLDMRWVIEFDDSQKKNGQMIIHARAIRLKKILFGSNVVAAWMCGEEGKQIQDKVTIPSYLDSNALTWSSKYMVVPNVSMLGGKSVKIGALLILAIASKKLSEKKSNLEEKQNN